MMNQKDERQHFIREQFHIRALLSAATLAHRDGFHGIAWALVEFVDRYSRQPCHNHICLLAEMNACREDESAVKPSYGGVYDAAICAYHDDHEQVRLGGYEDYGTSERLVDLDKLATKLERLSQYHGLNSQVAARDDNWMLSRPELVGD